MPAYELQDAVKFVVELIETSGVKPAVSDFRTALVSGGNVRSKHQLDIAGTRLITGMARMNPLQRRVCQVLHLDKLGSQRYWDSLLDETADKNKIRAELVHLYSRIMFASNHLPMLLALQPASLESSGINTTKALDESYQHVLSSGNQLLKIRLLEAGESVSDPDRISRTIDGVDMIYNACASIAKKPAVDLSVVRIVGSEYKEIVFEGDAESISSVHSVVHSIAEKLAETDDLENCDPDELVKDLPVFTDLQRLSELGSFRSAETDKIAETLHEGILLVMESGVLLDDEFNRETVRVEEPEVQVTKSSQTEQPQLVPSQPEAPQPESVTEQITETPAPVEQEVEEILPVVSIKRVDPTDAKPADPEPDNEDDTQISPDEFYSQYLKEKQKLQARDDKEAAGSAALAMFLQSDEDVAPQSNADTKTGALNELILDLDRVTKK